MDNNPIYYKDLVTPDNSVTELIKQLDELSDTYKNTQKNIREEALKLSAAINGVSGATAKGRATAKAATADADKLARAQRDLAFAESENAVKLAELKQAQREANEINKLTVKLNQSAEGSYNKLSAQYSLNKIYLNNMSTAEREAADAGKLLESQTKDIYEEMKRLQEATGKYVLDVGNYGKASKGIAEDTRRMKEEIQALRSEYASTPGNIEAILEANKRLNSETRALQGQLEKLNKKAKEIRDSGTTDNGLLRELTRLETESKEVVEALTEIQRESNALNKEMVEGQKAANGYSEQIRDLLGVNNQFASSLLDLATDATPGKFFDELGMRAKAFGKTLIGLMANPAFLVIAGIAGVGAAFKFWYDYNVGLQEATRLTQQFTGKSGDDLKAYRNELQAVADVFDQDFRETLESTNALAKQFGISYDEALKLIRDGFVAGGQSNKEYLETIKEYPAFFKEAGLSASQFVAIASQAGKQGIYSDKAVDTIKEGNIRIREMTKATAEALQGIGLNYKTLQEQLQSGAITTFDVMQMVSQKLNELPENSAAVGTAIADIFGGAGEDAGLQYLKTLKDIDTNLDTVKANAGELGALQEKQLESQAELTNVVSGLFDQTGGTFEMLITYGKIFVNDILISIVKGLIDTVNYFIDWYNKSLLVRVQIQGIIIAFKLLWEVSKTMFSFMISQFKLLANVIKAAFTFDYKGMQDAMKQFAANSRTIAKDIVSNTMDAFKTGVDNVNKKLKPITIPVRTGTGVAATPATPTGGTKPAKIADYDKPAKDTSKELEAIRKKNLELLRKYEDAQLELERDEFKKRRQQAIYNFSRQREDLKHQLDTDKDLTTEAKKAINDLIKNLELQQTAALEEIEGERLVNILEMQKAGIQARLDATRKGSEQEYKLRKELLEKERQLALQQNRNKAPGQRQDESEINAGFDAQGVVLDDGRLQQMLKEFDLAQDLAQSEFDLLRASEGRKTRFRLQAEKDRLNKVLELNKQMGNQLSDVEVKTIENTIKKIDKEIGKSKKDEKGKDIYGLLGINLDDEAKEAISQSTSFALGQINDILAAKVAAADVAVQLADKEVDSTQRRLEAELTARANGYASDVATAQKELDNARKNQAKANRDKEKAVKQQQAMDAAIQASSLITASAQIWSSLSGIPVVGTALAIAAIGLMWGSFAASKIKARNMTKTGAEENFRDGNFEFLTGGSHQSGNDVDLGTKSDGTRRRAEGGEAWGVISKMGTRKYRSILPNIFSSLSRGTFDKQYMNAYSDGENINMNVYADSKDMKQIKDDVSAMRNGRKFIPVSDGIIQTYKNLTRKVKNN